jgi:hypothetical protein
VKSQILSRKLRWKNNDGKWRTRTVTEKVIARWSAAHAARDAHTRADMLTIAAGYITDPARHKASSRKGAKKYITELAVDTATGELTEPAPATLALDTARAEADAELDGYWLIRTSLTDTPDTNILDAYKQLWVIEDTFKVTKTDLEARPVYVWTPEHIEAHFLTCFLALTFTRVLSKHTGLSPSVLQQALAGLTATKAGPGIHLIERPPAWDTIDQTLGIDTNHRWATTGQLRDWKRQIKTTTKQLFPYTP